MVKETPQGPAKTRLPFSVDRLEFEVAQELGLDPSLLRRRPPASPSPVPRKSPPRG
ncbi:MAG: hypothetical protein AB1576_11465 [Bacillota bacterium]